MKKLTISKLGILKVAQIKSIKELTPKDSRIPVKAITLLIPEIASKARPGQFAMMWIYGIDEKPMGFAGCKDDEITFAVAKIGLTTTKIHTLKEGDLLGIRGPYGKGFNLQGKKIAIMGGGTGIAPTKFLVERALENNIAVTLFHGARTANELAFIDYFEKLASNNKKFLYNPSTDDGSLGFCGFSTYCLEDVLDTGEEYDCLYTCGPELMMYNAWKIAKKRKTPFEACLADRYFKCAIGLCGQCTVDPSGLRLCIDGPVFNGKQLEKITDFGKFARDKYGRKIPLREE